ncbi:phosphoenolpyruvate--protein phosphotransferase [Magnetospirillum aberrantis]|uniref:Phosphoenolpyruvate--protein phosphotransferase n=1 Tax=Magnetospirillum aberrantis SpK TaxID=908842 RepID=A0A7C9UXR1_9PROT|nr:phosphoenolpyruvate--protein phosphotransferase [Magnetospirillum aberrantis]NFV81072.1 phosphoenolpyruvate--protein phosphotransferase [Magnetospirillum aberrantis SpK]
MVGIVLVSHSKALALALADLVAQMVGPDFPVAVAAGVGDDFAELGTDAVHISEVLRPFCDGDGALVLMDLGSAVLSAQTAVELLEADDVPDVAAKIRLVAAPLVEAAVAASVLAKAGGTLDDVAAEALAALAPKQGQLGDEPTAFASAPPVVAVGEAVEIEADIANPHGLHARPAATLVQAMGGFAAEVTLVNLTNGRGPASARSLTAVGLVQARKGDRLRFSVRGADAGAAADRLRALIADHFGEADLVAHGEAFAVAPEPKDDGKPVGVSEGIALGRVMALSAALPVRSDYRAETPERELARLDAALIRVADELRRPAGLDAKTAAIFAAQALMLEDNALLAPVRAKVVAGEASALGAWRDAAHAVADQYAAMDDPYLRARAADLRDIAGRVERALAGQSASAPIVPDPPAILVTDELLPSEAMACRPGSVLGIVAQRGSPTAHAAILIRGLGIPMVVGASPDQLFAAGLIGMDGASGEIWVDPTAEQQATITARRQALESARAADRAGADQPAVTRDGVAVEVLANVATAADAAAAKANGAEGVGLLRTEFAYLSFSHSPSEEEQYRALADILAPLGAGPVVVRTPDIGADKPAPYLPPRPEQNPFLGVRGVRLSLREPDFFASNLRAILRAGLGRDLWIMLPMVTVPDEVEQARALLEQAHEHLSDQGVSHAWPVCLGMMVEVPAAALCIQSFLGKVDFLSIGTNDLTQYLLAAERGNAELSELQDATHPAVLRVIGDLCAAADAVGCHVSVCGDAASNPAAAALLVGAGIRSLSVRPNQVGAIKARIREWSVRDLAAGGA